MAQRPEGWTRTFCAWQITVHQTASDNWMWELTATAGDVDVVVDKGDAEAEDEAYLDATVSLMVEHRK